MCYQKGIDKHSLLDVLLYAIRHFMLKIFDIMLENVMMQARIKSGQLEKAATQPYL